MTTTTHAHTGGPPPRPHQQMQGRRWQGPAQDHARRSAVVAALAAVLAWALVSAWWMPRGPVSTMQSLACVASGLALGVLLGWTMRSRWAALLGPALFVAVYEVARLPVDGPTVDGVQLSTYGVLALVTGRVFHGLVLLVPMAWGAMVGAAVTRQARPWVHVVIGVGLLALVVPLARPASTAPITGPDGEPLRGSVAELTSVEVDGHDLGLMIRGNDRSNPVLLFLAGGPGGSELGAMRRHLPELEKHFVVATWDQRGTGRSYGELDPVDTLTLKSAVDDTLAVTSYLQERFDQDRIVLVGQSWGSTLGVLAVQAAPERYRAFVGVGQMVSQPETDRIFYADTLAWAEEEGRDDLVDDLLRIGAPPYDDPREYEIALSHEMEMYPYDHGPNSEGRGQMSENIFVREYSLTEQVRLLSGMLDTFVALYPQLQEIDFRETATTFEVPMFFVQGAHEAPGRAEVFDEWYPMVEAPVKDLVVLDTSGHRPMFEQPDEFVDHMVEVVLPQS